MLIAGQPGTGKTAIAMGKIVQSLICNNIAFWEKVNLNLQCTRSSKPLLQCTFYAECFITLTVFLGVVL